VTSAAELFDLLWESLADVLGTAAGATLLRRAIKPPAPHSPIRSSWPATAWTTRTVCPTPGSSPITTGRSGLAIVRTIVDAHGGRLGATNNEHGGATVHFTLPVRRKDEC